MRMWQPLCGLVMAMAVVLAGGATPAAAPRVVTVLGTGEPGDSVTQVNNPYGIITGPDGATYKFDIEPSRKERMLNGLDDIGITEQYAPDIAAFEATRPDFLPRVGA